MALRHKSKYLREKTEEELPTSVQITVYDSGKTHINWIFFFMPCIKDFENNKENFLIHVQTNQSKAFPSYRVVDTESLEDVTSLKIKILNYVFEE